MAVLSDHDLSLEVAYREFLDGWVHYNIWLRWRGEPVINDAILKRHNDYWAGRGVGAINACEHRTCGVLPLLRRVLESKEADYWEATDPDVILGIYPGGGIPFLPSKWSVVHEAPHIRADRLAREAQRAKTGPLPDDPVEVLLAVDVYNFAHAHFYQGSGVCFRVGTTWQALATFYGELRAEFVAFRDKNGIDTFNRRDLGPDYEAPWF